MKVGDLVTLRACVSSMLHGVVLDMSDNQKLTRVYWDDRWIAWHYTKNLRHRQ